MYPLRMMLDSKVREARMINYEELKSCGQIISAVASLNQLIYEQQVNTGAGWDQLWLQLWENGPGCEWCLLTCLTLQVSGVTGPCESLTLQLRVLLRRPQGFRPSAMARLQSTTWHGAERGGNPAVFQNPRSTFEDHWSKASLCNWQRHCNKQGSSL